MANASKLVWESATIHPTNAHNNALVHALAIDWVMATLLRKLEVVATNLQAMESHLGHDRPDYLPTELPNSLIPYIDVAKSRFIRSFSSEFRNS
jgi:hypothetical protein